MVANIFAEVDFDIGQVDPKADPGQQHQVAR